MKSGSIIHFFEQIGEDLKEQHILRYCPREYITWKPKDSNIEAVKDWEIMYGPEIEAVHSTHVSKYWDDLTSGLDVYGGYYMFTYNHEEWVTLYLIHEDYGSRNRCQGCGGICMWINKYDYTTKFFSLYADDGYVGVNNYKTDLSSVNIYEKVKLLSGLNDLKIDGFDCQEAVKILWEFKLCC